MKKLTLVMIMTLLSLTVSAQGYQPNTKWPYVYDSFYPGTIYFEGNEKSTADMNIHLWGNVLHYIAPDGRIHQGSDSKVVRVEIADNAYIYSDHKLVKIISADGTNLLVKLTKGDFDAMRDGTGGAYGSSLNSSAAQDLSSLGFDLGGLDNPDIGLLLQDKHEGRAIPIVEKYFFIIGGQQVEANKKAIAKFIGSDKEEAFKQFVKENKIKWKNEESLKKLLEFFGK